MSEADILKEALQEGLMSEWREENEDHERKPGEYYPSGIGYCLRRQYYEISIPRPPSAETLAVFATGKGIHEAVARALQRSGKVKVEMSEMPVRLGVTDRLSLSGRVDILLAEIGGNKAVVEVKSTSRIPNEPHEHHLLQLQTYLHALQLELGLLLYWDKRNGELKAFNVKRDRAWLEKAGERVIILDEHLRTKTAPVKESFVAGRYWDCDYCPYLQDCSPFVLGGVPPGSRLAMFGLTHGESHLESPRTDSLAAFASERKREGDLVVILSDSDESHERSDSERLKREGVLFDVFLSKPPAYRSPSFWKSELGRRLARTYQISLFSDDSPDAVDAARSFARKSQVY